MWLHVANDIATNLFPCVKISRLLQYMSIHCNKKLSGCINTMFSPPFILLVYMLVPFVAIGQCIATIWLREIWVDPNNQHVGSMANLEFQVRVV